jgi:acylphosphatase
MTKHYNIRVNGRVQGVWFRAGAQHKAQELGLTGFARNEKDGSVYIEAEGPEEQLQEFLDWCEEGTMAAKVESRDWEEGPYQGYERFKTA